MLEFACACIVAAWLLVRLPMARDRRRFAGELFAIGALAWAAEQTCIVAYGFYTYAPQWTLMVGDVPLMVALIWPVVIGSARDLLRPLCPSPVRLSMAVGLLVLADAAFIEPAAVAAQLWRWHHPGLFGVPPAGILGWALYAAAVVYALERPSSKPINRLLALAAVVPFVHLGLLAAWWAALRWIDVSIPDFLALLLAALVAIGVIGWLIVARVGRRVPLRAVFMRLPGALFFAGLLLLAEPDDGVIAWSLAFVPPWLVLMVGAARGGGPLKDPAGSLPTGTSRRP